MTLRDQIRSDPGRICSRITAWDQALWWGTGEFVIVLDSCCISIGLVFIKDRPVSSFWVLRFRSRVLRFRDRGASFSSFVCFMLRSSFSSASFSKLPPYFRDIERKVWLFYEVNCHQKAPSKKSFSPHCFRLKYGSNLTYLF